MSARKDFLSQPAPENYVAGLGRGATGFTTRSDLGPAREGPSEEQLKEALAKRAAQLGANAPTAYGVPEKKKEQEEKDDEDDARFVDPDNEYGLFAGGLYDKDDEEADQIYAAVTEKMEKRRKARREEREKMERDEYEAKNPKISQQFADAKRALGAVTEEEWANLPEVGDLTGKRKRERAERLASKAYAVPDSVLAGARDAMQIETSISTDAPDTADGTITNFAAIGAARNKLLDARLRQAEQGAGGDGIATGTATALDQKGYLTSLANVERAGEANIGDISRTRDLLESVTKTNPTSAPGWVSLARLEEYAGKTVAARNAIKKGCSYCPKSDDVWLESIRLHMGGNNHNAKIIVADAIKVNPYSVKLWIAAMELESDPRARKKVLRQALDLVPKSVVLWKAAANLEEDPNDAKLLLAKATEFIPQSVELWLALARLESDKNAAAVLNKARIAIPTSHEIWIAACRLQEQLGKPDLARTVMTRGIQSLAKQSAMLKREEWIEEAEKAESEGALLTCQAIIENTLGWELDEEDDRADVWLQDAKESTGRGRYGTARAMLAYALRVFPKKRKVWTAALDLERNHGSRIDLLDLLMTAVKAVPDSDDFWLQLARERTQAGELDEARKVLAMAFEENASENIWLAAVKLESDTKNYDQARELLRNARDSARTDRIWIKSVAFERQLGNTDAALDLVNQGLQEHPQQPKLWMMKGQIYESKSLIPKARETYSTGTRACPKSIPLWLLASRLEEKAGILVKARSTLDKARLANPKSPQLWNESVRLERRANNLSAANNLMSQALQELPSSGLLWSEKIMTLEQRTHRKARALEAAKKCETDPSLYLLYITIARVFWAERKLDKAVNWFEKAIVLDPDWGDTWAWYFKFLQMHGTDEKKADVVAKCVLAEPRHGEVWAGIAKDPANAGIGIEGVLMKTVKALDG